jgi:hypothetical protein
VVARVNLENPKEHGWLKKCVCVCVCVCVCELVHTQFFFLVLKLQIFRGKLASASWKCRPQVI